MTTLYVLQQDIAANVVHHPCPAGNWVDRTIAPGAEGQSIVLDLFASWKKKDPKASLRVIKRTEETIVCTTEMVKALDLKEQPRDFLKDWRPGE